MATSWRPRSTVGHQSHAPSPLRHASTASSTSSGPPSRSSTVSSRGSSTYQILPDRTRTSTQTQAIQSKTAKPEEPPKTFGTASYQAARLSLRPTSSSTSSICSTETVRAPADHSVAFCMDSGSAGHGLSTREKHYTNGTQADTLPYSTASHSTRPMSMALSRSDSVSHKQSPHFASQLEAPSLEQFQKSSTSHLRALSKFASEGDDFSITTKDQEVAGLHGRRRLQRGDSVRAKKAQSGWAGTAWIDQQRQYLAAYEYLCHIGEAKEWIEDVVQKPIPAIVQLEEALRNGVILAELVQALFPDRKLRIFRGPNLTFRHSDNIAIFFRLLEEIELPDLFWFELVDLYEKKNIPKVIHCIHALSWLLWRKGMTDFRIGNLVGQLQFEDHELEATQKGLDRAGINMPNFAGMGANFGAEPEPQPEPEPEPQESEDDRVDRELGEQEHIVLDLQAQIRGASLRSRLGTCMEELWDVEPWIVQLQAKLRGEFAREISNYRLDMKRFSINLQAAARGFVVRSRARQQQYICKYQEQNVIAFQTLFRASQARTQTQHIQTSLNQHIHSLQDFQAVARGALRRQKAADQWQATRKAERSVNGLQAAIKGVLARKQIEARRQELMQQSHQVTKLQSVARALLQRRAQQVQKTCLRQQESLITVLQAAVRASAQRRVQETIQTELRQVKVTSKAFQHYIRGYLLRREVQEQRRGLLAHAVMTTTLQSNIRGFNTRCKQSHIQTSLANEQQVLQEVQSAVRGYLLRKRTFDLLDALHDHEDNITCIQAHARALLCRSSVGHLFAQLEEVEDSIVALQSIARGKIVRADFEERRQHFRRNMEKVIKVQSFIRAKQQGEAYKILTSGKNPPVGTVKNFVHLLNDSDFDFDEEIEFERLRKTIVQRVRENEHAEEYVDDLDIKIALLVKNKITLDEVVRHQSHFTSSMFSNKDYASKDQFDLKALNKHSRKKLEHYQELFFLLQTQPQYLARLLLRVRDHALPDSEFKKTEMLILSVYGLAQKRREEYYLLRLIARSMYEEIARCDTIQDYLRGTFFWSKILQSYVRSPRDRRYLRDLLSPLVKEDILDNEELDLESDPMQIYRSAINNEELRTGQRSRRPMNISREEAIRDKETKDTFIKHLQDLRDLADHFFICLEDTLLRMPYGIRFVAQQMFQMLCTKFSTEPHQQILNIVGHWVWKTYIQPALLQPDTWGVVDRGLSPLQKRNLSEVSKVVGQVAAGRLFGGDNVFLQPINPYISESMDRIEDIWTNLINVKKAEEHFDIDEFNDLYSRTKPTLYMKLPDVFAIHRLVAQDVASVCPDQNDPLRDVLRELGSAKNNENDMMQVSSTDITLTLNPKFHDVEDPDAAVKALFMETKRCVLYIIRVQAGKNLLEIMVRPIARTDEDKWAQLVQDELRSQNSDPKKKNPYQDSSSLLDIASMSYKELKRTTLENIITLERTGRISRSDQYQELLNDIALDIRTKHRRRIQRHREMENARANMSALEEKQVWLRSQLQSYNDYIESAMVTLQSKSKDKKRFLLPFTKQWDHERELARSGRKPKFGSYKYSARNLVDKGVLLHWNGYTERQWDRNNITISSDKVGIFQVEGSAGNLMIPGAHAVVTLDDLLQCQFENQQFVHLFDVDGSNDKQGPLKINVNLLVHLLMKKFYL